MIRQIRRVLTNLFPKGNKYSVLKKKDTNSSTSKLLHYYTLDVSKVDTKYDDNEFYNDLDIILEDPYEIPEGYEEV